MAMTRENSQAPESGEQELVSAPMRSLYEITKLRNIRSSMKSESRSIGSYVEDDFISRGVLSIDRAEELFGFFNQTMNQYLWGGIALKHDSLNSVRSSSSLLSAAVLTVSALHVPGKDEIFDTCYNEFVTVVSNSMLNRYHSLDEIRGLCIGAFWLSDLSWKLSGHAVRIATEINLHQSLQKLLRGASDEYERAQLWYLLYVLDHHFSIAYQRPPIIHENQAIRSYELFLQCPSTVPGDVRLVCQVALFAVLTKAHNAFGSDIEPLSEQDFILLRAFNVEVEQWRLLWQPRSGKPKLPFFMASFPNRIRSG